MLDLVRLMKNNHFLGESEIVFLKVGVKLFLDVDGVIGFVF